MVFGSVRNIHTALKLVKEIMEDGFSYHQAVFLSDCIRWCEQHYEYETSHKDAANNYETLFTDQGIASIANVPWRHFEFTTDINAKNSVYLGNDEMEIQLPRKLTVKESEFISHNTDYVVNGESDLAYRPYPSNLSVIAVLS